MQSQTSTAASSLAALGHNSLFAAFTAHQGASALQSGPPASFSAPQAASHMAGGSGGSGAEGTAGHVPPLLSQIHPAFLHPFYHPFAAGIRPAVLAAAAISAGNGNNNIDNLERPGSAGKSFTIDAILGTRGGESAQPRRGGREAAGPRRGGPTTAALSPLSARGTLQHRSGLAVTHPGAPHPYLSSLTAPLSFRSAFSTRGNLFTIRVKILSKAKICWRECWILCPRRTENCQFPTNVFPWVQKATVLEGFILQNSRRNHCIVTSRNLIWLWGCGLKEKKTNRLPQLVPSSVSDFNT